jgi:uncharacterized protein YecE (DUF72 family)
MTELRIGTAGWSIPLREADAFPSEGSALERYAARFGCAEINSSFHRSHRAATWERWAASVPEDFLFSAKLSKEITHKRKLADCGELLAAALAEMRTLGPKLHVVLVQLPPSLGFDGALADGFFATMRSHWPGRLACEPRHASWFEAEADALLAGFEAARVAADPARVPEAAVPGGWRGFSYWRLHGTPVPYRSSYDDGRLELYAEAMTANREQGRDAWAIFDNTASGAATGDALKLQRLTDPSSASAPTHIRP